MEFKHAYSDGHRGSDLKCDDPSLAQQQFKEDADINVLLERFRVTGVMPAGVKVPQFGDFSGIKDFREAQDYLLQAKNSFMDLPPDIRAKFNHDPATFVDFATNPENIDSLRSLGLAPTPPVPPSPPPAKE